MTALAIECPVRADSQVWIESGARNRQTPASAGTDPGRGRLVGVDVVHSTCSAPECERPVKSLGLCTMHYHRKRRTGSVESRVHEVWEPVEALGPLPIVFRSAPMPERIWIRSRQVEHGCWYWTGDKDRGGYGRTSVGRRAVARTRLLHRLSYTVFVGPIPDELFLDHFEFPHGCIGPACFRPDHVRPVTTRENVLRADNHVAWNLAKTHCVHGHPLSGANLYVRPNGSRHCVTCKRAQLRAWRRRNIGRTGAP